jgi:hypothetical protein
MDIGFERLERGDTAKDNIQIELFQLDKFCRERYPHLYDANGKLKREQSRIQSGVRPRR